MNALAKLKSKLPEDIKQPIVKLVQRSLIPGKFSSELYSFRAETGREARVAMCLWNRPGRIDDVLQLLDAQDYPEGVRLFLWNNNRADHVHYQERIKAFTPGTDGALHSVRLKRSPYNIGGMSRFYWARWLLAHGEAGAAIYLDDDENILSTFVSTAMRAVEEDPNAIHAWWAWNVHGGYWERERTAIGETANHVGPGGSVAPLDYFADTRFFTKMPEQFWKLDDIWFTHLAKAQGRTLKPLDTDIDFVLEETNQYHGQLDLKPQFFEYLKANDPLR